EGYGDHGQDHLDISAEDSTQGQKPMPIFLAILPLILVIGVNALFTYGIFPGTNFAFMAERFPQVDPAKITGLWALIIGLMTANLGLIISRLGYWKCLRESINKGVFGFMLPLFNTASEVGYGAVIASLAGFAIIRDFVLNVAPGNPLISEAVAMTTLAGITGSSSGGLSIALQTLGSDYLAMAQQAGISPELLHRVAVMAARSEEHTSVLQSRENLVCCLLLEKK